jgi:hypothetical protein
VTTRRTRKKTVSQELNEAELPKKGESTFSCIDSAGETKGIEPSWADLIGALKETRKIEVSVTDDREPHIIEIQPRIENPEPVVNVYVDPTPVQFEPNIDVNVPPQPPAPTPIVEVRNEIDLTVFCVGIFLVMVVLTADLVWKIWQSQM